MNYTKTLRQFCMKNKGNVFDAAKMAEDYFSMIPYKTLLKILNRLQSEGLLSPISKGVYQIIADEPINKEDAIKSTYVDLYNGMYVGYKMYNHLGISPHNDGYIEIYTNKITTKHKNIANFKLTRANVFFDKVTTDIIQALELIENIDNIKDIDFSRYYELRQRVIHSYNDNDFYDIINELTYQYSTIATFDMLVKEHTSNKCNCAKIYQHSIMKK